MKAKIEELLSSLPSLEEKLSSPEIHKDKKQFKELSQRYAYIQEVKETVDRLSLHEKTLHDNEELLKTEKDPDFIAFVTEENSHLIQQIDKEKTLLQTLLIPPDPNDSRNVIIELRAGTGGDEAALFVGDCVRMYKLFADSQSWGYEELSSSPSDLGGYKEYVMVLTGKDVYRYLRYEGGTHRVQRVPETEAQGRVHTSAITVAVLLEPDEETDLHIEEKDLRIDTYRASGAGGQHVNVTDSAVRITHIPTGIVSYCQEERSQHKNKEKAMRLLKAKIAEAERERKERERSDERASQVGSGDRSERIRTYNFPQNRITDHRINFTRYNLDRAMNGALDELTHSLVAHYRKV